MPRKTWYGLCILIVLRVRDSPDAGDVLDCKESNLRRWQLDFLRSNLVKLGNGLGLKKTHWRTGVHLYIVLCIPVMIVVTDTGYLRPDEYHYRVMIIILINIRYISNNES